ncbi:hypothetical protein ACHMW5_36045 (plasmid) [Azospirillum melinis]|uniref:hypothetical protein n=1 Tax=Azospirillum melinis TaxID=328839 RepID=UPI003757A33A
MAEFSRRTVLAAIDVIDGLNQAQISSFMMELGPSVYTHVRGEGVSSTKRMNDLKLFVDNHPTHTVDGEPLKTVIVEKAASLVPNRPAHPWSSSPRLTPAMEVFKRILEQNGFVIADGGLRRTLPADLGVPETESELMRLLDQHGLTTAKGHLEQAFDAHTRGKWASANGQLRTFFDALLDELAVKLDPSASTLGSGQARRGKLAALGFLSLPLNEWDNDGKGFINGLVKRLHPQGAHPGLSDEDDSTFRLHTVLITAVLLLRRFDRAARL